MNYQVDKQSSMDTKYSSYEDTMSSCFNIEEFKRDIEEMRKKVNSPGTSDQKETKLRDVSALKITENCFELSPTLSICFQGEINPKSKVIHLGQQIFIVLSGIIYRYPEYSVCEVQKIQFNQDSIHLLME